MDSLEKMLQEAQQIQGGENVLHFLQMLHLVIDTIPQRVFWKDTNSVYLGCNMHFAKDAGLSHPSEVIGKSDFDLPWAEYAETYRQYDRDVMTTGIAKTGYEQFIHTAQGEVICARSYKVPLRNKDGTLVGVLAAYEDITNFKMLAGELHIAIEQKRREAQLRKLAQAMEQSPVSLVITDRHGRIEYVNQKYIELSGYTSEELSGNKSNLLRSGYHPTEFYREMWATLHSGKEWAGIFCNKKKNGELYWESATISSLKDDLGRITHFIGIKQDITAQKKIEEALQQSEKKFRAIYEQANDAIALWSETEFLDCNPCALEMFGYNDKKEFLRTHPAVISPEKQPDGRSSLEASEDFKGKALTEGTCHFEWIHKRANGEHFPVDVQLSSIDWEGRKLLLAIGRDITERKQAQALLEAQKREIENNYDRLKKLEALRDNLTHMIVHDMRSPLTSIKMALQMLELNLPSSDSRVASILGVSQKSTQQLIEMATQLLDVSRLEAGEMPLEKERRDLREIIHSVTDLFPATTCQRSISLSPIAPIFSFFDVDVIKRVLMNFVSNAIKFTPVNGAINIRLEQNEGFARLSVTDTGIGIATEYLDKIFEKFVQAQDHHKQLGTGLGLHFCKLAIEAHGGRIGVESQVNQGSTFWFTLPAA